MLSGRCEEVVIQVVERFLRVHHTAHDSVVAHDDAPSRTVLVHATVNQNALEVRHVTHPGHHTIIFLGVGVLGEVRELRRLDKGDFIGSERDAGLRINFLLSVVKLAVVVQVAVLILDGVTDVHALAVGHVIEVTDGVQAFECCSFKPQFHCLYF